MGALENSVAQCRGVEASNGRETYDLGQENQKLKNQLDAAAKNLTEQNSGVLSYFKKGTSGDALRAAAESSVSRQIEGVSKEWRFDACSNAGREIQTAINAAKNSKSADAYIASVSRQAPQVAGVKHEWAPQVAMNDNFQNGVNALKKGGQQSRLDAAMSAAGAN